MDTPSPLLRYTDPTPEHSLYKCLAHFPVTQPHVTRLHVTQLHVTPAHVTRLHVTELHSTQQQDTQLHVTHLDVVNDMLLKGRDPCSILIPLMDPVMDPIIEPSRDWLAGERSLFPVMIAAAAACSSLLLQYLQL
jgi:hypothetical protein